jgi:hypothetical protein
MNAGMYARVRIRCDTCTRRAGLRSGRPRRRVACSVSSELGAASSSDRILNRRPSLPERVHVHVPVYVRVRVRVRVRGFARIAPTTLFVVIGWGTGSGTQTSTGRA